MAYDPRASSEERTPEPGRRRGPRIGPIAITPVRVFLPLALVGSLVYAGYAVSVRDTAQIPALAMGAAMLGLVFVALAVAGVVETVRAGRTGRALRSMIAAVFGGVAGIVAFGCFAAAVLLMLLTRPPAPG